MFPLAVYISLFTVLLQSTLSAAYSWRLNADPKQCSNLSISITGSDGQPPYRVLLIPSGPSPFASNAEVRSVIDKAFDNNSTTVNFSINYPANSHFVAVVSDATGFGTGGTSVEMKVTDSNDTSCFDPTVPWSPLFHYSFGSNNEIVQCGSTRVWWNASETQGTPTFVGVIPGGQSFPLQESNITNVTFQGTGFAWTPSIRGGTTLLVAGGDNRGLGTGGYAQFTVLPGSDSTCLNSLSPSSTPGTPAGSIATNVVVTSSAAAKDGGPNVTAIIGGVVGGIIGVMTLITFSILSYYCLRQGGKNTRRLKKRPPLDPSVTMVSRQKSGRSGSTSTRSDPLALYNPEAFPFLHNAPGGSSDGYICVGQVYPGIPPGAAPPNQPRSRATSEGSTSGIRASDISSPIGSRYGPPPPLPPNAELLTRSRLPSSATGVVNSFGMDIVETSSQMGPTNGVSPTPTSHPSNPILRRGGSSSQNVLGPNEPPPATVAPLRVKFPPRTESVFKVTNPDRVQSRYP